MPKKYIAKVSSSRAILREFLNAENSQENKKTNVGKIKLPQTTREKYNNSSAYICYVSRILLP